MSLLNILAALVPGLIPKKAPYCVWIRVKGGIWAIRNPAGNSARRCKKAVKVFLDMETDIDDIMILPKGVTPP